MPATRNTIAMMNSRLSMNGVVPMMSPVTGSRSGAPGGSVNSRISAMNPRKANSA